MADIRFTWDPDKDATNRRKHGVSFDEARSVFLDENAKLIDDPDHSFDEDRFVLLGLSRRLRLLVVCHTYRQEDEEVRIISARKANKHEAAQYTE
ncbi:MAG: BrnT family toxin [Tepidisphaerales bacterium]